MDLMQIFLVVLSVILVSGLPALLLFRATRFSLIESIGLVLMGQSILFSLTALLYRYSMVIFVIETAIFCIILFFFQRRRRIKINNIPVLVFVSILFLALPMIASVPFGTDGQGFGSISLAVKQGQSIKTLEPHYPDVEWVYSPAFPLFTAFYSDFSKVPIHVVMPVLSAVFSVLILIAGFEFGKYVKNKRFGIILSFCMTFGLWLLAAHVDSHYAALLATLFMLLFLLFFFRNMKTTFKHTFLSGFALAAIVYAHPDTIFNLLIALLPFYILIFLAKDRPKKKTYLVQFLWVPIIALMIFLPYLIYALSVLIRYSVTTVGFVPRLVFLKELFLVGGIIIPLLAFAGIYFAIRNRKAVDLLMVVWFFAVIEFSSIGFFHWLFSYLPVSPTALLYTKGVALNSPIVPYSFLAAIVLYNLYIYFKNSSRLVFVEKNIDFVISLAAVLSIIAIFTVVPAIAKALPLPIYGEFSSEQDVDAMLWIKENSELDAYVLNYPRFVDPPPGVEKGYFRGHWVPVISERKSVFNRIQPFFFNTDTIRRDQSPLYYAYLDPASDESKTSIHDLGIDYVIVPDPDSASRFSWKPDRSILTPKTSFDETTYVELVYQSGGAKVYKVK